MLKAKAMSEISSIETSNSKNMSINPTKQKGKVGAVQVIKTTAISGRTAKPEQAIPATTTANPKLIKRAHVRFDDYLDLNEENMRRSCKRLMNHLYSDSTTSNDNNSSQNQATQNVAPAISHCRSQSQQQPANKCPNIMQKGASRSAQNSNLNRTTLPQQTEPVEQTKTVTSKGKSYLRSQYERRQLRQLELMQQENSATANRQVATKSKLTTDGAIIEDAEEENRRRQQQDLMARSHELSKRRFFEKLERRESLKNLNSNINSITPIMKQKSKNLDLKLCKQSAEITKEVFEDRDCNQRAGNEQKKPIIESKGGCISNNIAAKNSADDELMLKAYQSILKGSTELQEDNNDTLGRLDGANIKELTSELVELYPPSLKSANACEHELHKHKADQLIEPSTNAPQLSLMVAETFPKVASDADSSAFEIRVTGTEGDFSADSLDQIDGFIKSENLLVVKQVESASIEGYQSKQERESQDETNAFLKANQWLSSLDGCIEASTQMVSSNKTKTPPLVVVKNSKEDSSEVILELSREEQISDGSGNEKRTCTSSSPDLIVSAQKSMPIKSLIKSDELSTMPAALSETPIDSDNQQPAASVSSTISGSRGNRNEMKTISSLEESKEKKEGEEMEEVRSETTGIVERVSDRKSDKSEHSNSTSEQQQSAMIEVGESNCAKNHESPETVMFVGQSGGAGENRVCTGEPSAKVESAQASQIESAAQVQQVINLREEITKLTIRDVLPEANGIFRKKIVSGDEERAGGSDSGCCTSQQVVEDGKKHREQRAASEQNFLEKVEDKVKAQDKEQVEVLETIGYANPKQKPNEAQENNVITTSCDVIEDKMNPFEFRNDNGGLMNENDQLIKSFTENVHTKLVQKQSSSVQSTAEEDNGSSCSSSGFGASASSSSDGSASIKGTDSVAVVGIKLDNNSYDFRRPNSLAIKSRDDHRESSTCNSIYDSICFPRNSVRMQHSSDKFEFPSHYKRLVGPDQGYPSKPSNRTLVIENHNYASIVNRCELDQSKAIFEPQSISLERDDFVGYANLPRKKAPPVEYATVRPISNNNGSKSSKNNPKDSCSEISLSAQSYSTTSANSGGFSALPPAQVEHHSPANNFDSLVSLNPDNSHRKSSIFKRFGSLVSKAFTGTGTATSHTTNNAKTTIRTANLVINNDDQQQVTQEIDCQRKEKNGNQNIGANGKSKLALVIEQDHHKVTGTSQEKVEEADLVILPAKHVNKNQQQRKHHQQEQNLALIRRNDDDRLSRGKKHSRKVKRTNSSTSLDSTLTTSSSSSYSLSHQKNDFKHNRYNGHLRKADSLSEDLESLMSRSEKSNGYEKQKNLKSTLIKVGTLPNIRNKTVKSSLERIEIDCIQPKNNATADNRGFKGSGKQLKSVRLNQSSLLGLMNKTTPPARCIAVESTPNLMKSQLREFRDSNFDSGTHQDKYINESEEEYVDENEVQQPISGFWGFSSLMNRSHAKTSENVKGEKCSRREWTSRSRIKNVENIINQEASVCNLQQPLAAGYKLHLSAESSQEERQKDKCQSLNLYQNLLRNCNKRRHRHHSHHHGHHRHHYHHHGRVYYSASRHAHHSARCGKNCLYSTNSETSTFDDKALVWGQLIKINKSDTSQVIELQRSPGRPWGFFVARGAINNTKGIFISRIHDKATSESLTGLLSIGDRILAIDECLIEPDYDILRVNQMISKKSKILLKVKPYKG